jgi:hypothetical protein
VRKYATEYSIIRIGVVSSKEFVDGREAKAFLVSSKIKK